MTFIPFIQLSTIENNFLPQKSIHLAIQRINKNSTQENERHPFQKNRIRIEL